MRVLRRIPRPVRFALVGVANTGVDVAVFVALTLGLALPPVAANPLSYAAGMVFSFASNRRLTFAGLPHRVPPAVQFARFAAINLGSLVLTTALVHLLTPSLDPVGAKLAAVPVGLAWNYGLSRRLLFA